MGAYGEVKLFRVTLVAMWAFMDFPSISVSPEVQFSVFVEVALLSKLHWAEVAGKWSLTSVRPGMVN